jgi:hypothetical protein
MVLVARGVDSGTGINVLADAGGTGDMQVCKLAIATLGSEALVPATTADGLLVQISNPTAISSVITSVVPGTGVTNLGKAEDAVAASGDVGVFALAVRRDAKVASAANGDYHEVQVDALGAVWTADVQTEDAVAASGDRGSFVLAIQRTTRVSDAVDGDYVGFHTDSLGQVWITGTQIEDAVAGSGDTGHFMLAVRRDTPVGSSAAGDYHEIQVDAVGGVWLAGSQIEDAAATSGDRGLFMLAVRRDTATSGAANADYHELQVDATGYLRTIDKLSEVALSNSTTTALDNDGPVVKASAGTLYGFQGYCDAAGFVQVHNKASAPTSTNVPIIVIPVASGAPFSLDLGMRGRAFSTGIAFGFSSTGPTYTDGGSHLWVDAQFV